MNISIRQFWLPCYCVSSFEIRFLIKILSTKCKRSTIYGPETVSKKTNYVRLGTIDFCKIGRTSVFRNWSWRWIKNYLKDLIKKIIPQWFDGAHIGRASWICARIKVKCFWAQ